MTLNWSNYPNFTKQEFDCKETGENNMHPDFLEILQAIRETYNRPIFINSGFRSVNHSVERVKDKPGTHTKGIAADLRLYGADVMEFCNLAYAYGIRRFGFQQKGNMYGRFVHIDIADRRGLPQSTWSY